MRPHATFDFLVIGAQKAGTSSIHEYMRLHTHIVVPGAKEVPFFLENRSRKEVQDFFEQYSLKRRSEFDVVGKVTPQYLVGPGVSRNLHAHNPALRILVLVRNQLERTLSHYKMNRRRGIESLSFDDRISAIREGESLGVSSEVGAIVEGSLYGKLLSGFYHDFPTENIGLFSFSLFESHRISLLRSVFDFCGVDPSYAINMPEIVAHKGGLRSKFVQASSIRKTRILKPLKVLLPARYRRELISRYDRWNVIPDQSKPVISTVNRQWLFDIFSEDIDSSPFKSQFPKDVLPDARK
jgi:hypothetical protein